MSHPMVNKDNGIKISDEKFIWKLTICLAYKEIVFFSLQVKEMTSENLNSKI